MSDPSSSWQKPLPPLPPGQGGSDGAADSEDERDDLAQGNRLDEHIKSDRPDRLATSGPGMDTRAELDEGGRIDLWMDLKHKLTDGNVDLPENYAPDIKEYAVDKHATDCPPLNIVIFLVGSRGDIQPYIALALKLIEHHSHRVRIATHGEFKSFVLNANKQLAGKTGKDGIKLEGRLLFFDAGGDPRELMSYMVKNPGLLPGWESLRNGDIRKKKKMTASLLRGFYRSTYFADPVSGEQFGADAIISNPPAFAHVHVAEALGLPLLMSFTMPWTPTTAYGHPLVNIRASNAEPGLTNYLGYAMADQMVWQGLGHVINSFRKNMLGLEVLTSSQGAGVLDMLKIPWTYCWSDSLLPKPKDWKEHIDISGFYFFEDATSYTPPEDLAQFLKSGKAPIYIGFGSVPVENPEIVTETIYEAMRITGNRAIVSAGWAGLGKGGVPSDLEGSVYILTKDCPHDWLFAEGRLAAVCHHGGAGTTAIGLRNGLPSIIVPFFGDQKFWGDSILRAGAGPSPVPPKTLNAQTLADAIQTALDPQVKMMAEKIGENIRSENGEMKGVESFHRHLPLLNMRCDIDPGRVALWWDPKKLFKLSGAAAICLSNAGRLDMSILVPHRAREYETVQSNSDPILGGGQAVLEFATFSLVSFGQIFTKPKKGVINTFYGIPKGAIGLLGDLYDGFEHGPRMIGSEVREPGKVNGVLSGTYQGVKGLFTGLYDGFTGLVKEPMAGHRKEGAIGALKGTARGVANLYMHSYRGLFGFFVLPSRGAARSMRKLLNDSDYVLRAPRIASSTADARALSLEEQATIIRIYDELLQSGAHSRKKTFQRRMRKWFLGDERAFAVGLDEMDHEESSDGDLSRRHSEINLPQQPHKADSYPLPTRDHRDPPPEFSVDDSMMYTRPSGSRAGSVASSSSSTRRQLGYQQRRVDRLTERSSNSSQLSPTTSSLASPPAFSTDNPRHDTPEPSFAHEDGGSVVTETETMDSEMMRDLKDMFIAEREQQQER